MKNLVMICGGMFIAFSTFACSGQKEVKSPTLVDANAQAGASTEQKAPLTPAEEEAKREQSPAPETVEPSQREAVVEVVVDGVTRQVKEGETFVIGEQRMLFFYSESAAADCTNVSVENLIPRSLAGLCQMGFLPLEQGVKAGEERTATIKVTSGGGQASGAAVTRSFRVGVLPTTSND